MYVQISQNPSRFLKAFPDLLLSAAPVESHVGAVVVRFNTASSCAGLTPIILVGFPKCLRHPRNPNRYLRICQSFYER